MSNVVIVREPARKIVVQDDGPVGPAGPPGPAGAAGGEPYSHTQSTAAATWLIPHNRGRYPHVVVKMASGNRVIPDVIDSDVNNLTLVFATPETGTALVY